MSAAIVFCVLSDHLPRHDCHGVPFITRRYVDGQTLVLLHPDSLPDLKEASALAATADEQIVLKVLPSLDFNVEPVWPYSIESCAPRWN